MFGWRLVWVYSVNFLYMAAVVYLFSIFNDYVSDGTYMVHVGEEHIVSSTHLSLKGTCVKEFQWLF